MGRILFVDDDRFFGKPYAICLNDYFGKNNIVDVCTKIDDAMHYFHAHEDLLAIVLDVMMPPPQAEEYDPDDILEATEGGFATGIWYLRRLRSKIIERGVRIFVLTNRDYDQVRAMLDELKFPAGFVECERKIMVRADSLPGRVSALLNRTVSG